MAVCGAGNHRVRPDDELLELVALIGDLLPRCVPEYWQVFLRTDQDLLQVLDRIADDKGFSHLVDQHVAHIVRQGHVLLTAVRAGQRARGQTELVAELEQSIDPVLRRERMDVLHECRERLVRIIAEGVDAHGSRRCDHLVRNAIRHGERSDHEVILAVKDGPVAVLELGADREDDRPFLGDLHRE